MTMVQNLSCAKLSAFFSTYM